MEELGVPGASWDVLGRSWRVLRGFLGVSGRSQGSPTGVLGAALGSPWGAYRSLRGPGVTWGVHGGVLEPVIFCVGGMNLLFEKRNIDIVDVWLFLMNSDVSVVGM